MTLEEKLRAIIFCDDTGEGPISRAGEKPAAYHPGPSGYKLLSEFELDLRDWGVIYGMASGMARHEELCESHEAVAKRALDADWRVFLAYSGPFAERGSRVVG